MTSLIKEVFRLPAALPLFKMRASVVEELRKLPSPMGFNGLGEVVARRTYYRKRPDGTLEEWPDVVERVVNGIMSIRKYHMTHKQNLAWDEEKMQDFAEEMAHYMFNLYFSPPGRGLWACGTQFMYDNGSIALSNCAGVVIREDINRSIPWIMNNLMLGAGVGFRIEWSSKTHTPQTPVLCAPSEETSVFVIDDSRQGWTDSIQVLLEAYLPSSAPRLELLTHHGDYDRTKYPIFDYSRIRKPGEDIKGFGGKSSGPDPLIKLHLRIRAYMNAYLEFLNGDGGRERLLDDLATIDAYYVLKRNGFLENFNKVPITQDIQFTGSRHFVATLEIFRLSEGTKWLKEHFPTHIPAEASDSPFLIGESFHVVTYRSQVNELLCKIPDDEWKVHFDLGNKNRWMQVIAKVGLECEDIVYLDDGSTVEYIDILADLHKKKDYVDYSDVRFITDIINSIGVCIVAGNVRRSAEIAMCTADNETFRNLKNYSRYPERSVIGWMSNNSCLLQKPDDFTRYIPEIAKEVVVRGEPGFINMINIKNFGRVSPHTKRSEGSREHEHDQAEVTNPCGEIPLESYELCNLAEIFLPRCVDPITKKFSREIVMKAAEFATFYTSTVTLLPTEYAVTNEVISRNRRIGVSVTGVVITLKELGVASFTELMRSMHTHVEKTNIRLAKEAGIPASIRLTTVKPSGTVSLLAGVPPGIHYPPFRYAVRGIIVAENADCVPVLIEANVPYAKSIHSPNSYFFEFPIDYGDTPSADEITHWQQISIVELMQREWADNMVSATVTFPPNLPSDELSNMIALYAPSLKSCSLLPSVPEGTYPQMPFRGITKEEYEQRVAALKPINWNRAIGTPKDPNAPSFCDGDKCPMNF